MRKKYLENEFFPAQGKVGEFGGWPGKLRKDLESQGMGKEMAMAGSFRKVIYSVQEGKDILSPELV